MDPIILKTATEDPAHLFQALGRIEGYLSGLKEEFAGFRSQFGKLMAEHAQLANRLIVLEIGEAARARRHTIITGFVLALVGATAGLLGHWWGH